MPCCDSCAYGRAVGAAVAGYRLAPRQGEFVLVGLPLPEHIERGECLPLPDGMAEKVGPVDDEALRALYAAQHVSSRLLRAKDAEERVAGLRANPWFVRAVSGLTGRDETPESIGNALDVVRKADDVFSSVWGAAKGFVPYGEQIDKIHQARRSLLDKHVPGGWSAESRRRGGESFDKRGTVRAMQALHRAKRKGDARAAAEVAALKSSAARDAEARRRWHVYVAVAADDLARVTGGV